MLAHQTMAYPMNTDNLIETPEHLPVIDITALVARTSGQQEVADAIGRACREVGFFYVVGHGVNEELCTRIEELSREFFAQDQQTKMSIRMELGGRSWRGYFPVGAELTSGKPDRKEGIYFGSELGEHHPMVQAGTPIHGPNLFPDIAGFRDTVLSYMNAQTELGHSLMRGIGLSLGLDEDYFADRYTRDPLILFRIFNYPFDSEKKQWGVGEHTDYGLLTMLKQDGAGGLEVKSEGGWISAPPIPNSFVCNIGDMLDRMTRGLYRSTPHRVRNIATRDRLSFPFFFDPNFNAEVKPIDGISADFYDDRNERWDRSSVHELTGTYGDYLLNKVSRVFPDLRRKVL